jgi:hypothetical protein
MDKETVSKFRELSESEYFKIIQQQRGRVILEVMRIERREDTHFISYLMMLTSSLIL